MNLGRWLFVVGDENPSFSFSRVVRRRVWNATFVRESEVDAIVDATGQAAGVTSV